MSRTTRRKANASKGVQALLMIEDPSKEDYHPPARPVPAEVLDMVVMELKERFQRGVIEYKKRVGSSLQDSRILLATGNCYWFKMGREPL